jgi:2'-5' RNA ligase
MNKRRIFVGFKIPEKIKKRAKEWRGRRLFFGKSIRWIKDENLHITLLPPWYEENVEEILKKIKSIKNYVNPIKIIFEKIEFGPSKKPRLIWARGKSGIEILILKRKIEEILGQKDDRHFLLHLTLARFNPKNFKNFKVKNLKEEIFWNGYLSSFSLFESIFREDGVYYKTLLEIPLNSPPKTE